MHSQITEKTGPKEKQELLVPSDRWNPFLRSKRILVIFGEVMKPAQNPVVWISKQLGMAMGPNFFHGISVGLLDRRLKGCWLS